MIFTDNDNNNYIKSYICHICEKPLYIDKVRDHCHITGKYMGAAHNYCNFHRSDTRLKIPVFFHNGKGYDSHFIINEISNITDVKNISIIPKMR